MRRYRFLVCGSVSSLAAKGLLQAVGGCLLAGQILAADAFSGGTAVGTPSAGGAKAMTQAHVDDGFDAQMRIADAPWLDRELTRFCAALGRDPKPLRRALAETLYHTKTLDAIDTSRPAIFMWRKGSAPLQAIIPIQADKRRQFVEEFGVMGIGEAPLVRVGDRDGTVIFTQNHAEGLREYRLWITDSVAFLARNADECRKLAARASTILPVVGSGSAPVSLTCSGSWLRARNLLAWNWSPRLPISQWLPGTALLDAAQMAVVGQVDSMSFEIRPSADGKARLAVRLAATAESELAAWIATQQNQGSRLQTQIGGPDTAIKIASHVVWQDKLGQVAQTLAPGQRTARGEAWTPSVEEAWTQAFSLAERVVDAVWLLDVVSPGRYQQTLVLEQPRGDEQVQALDRLTGAYLPQPATQRAITGYQASMRTVPAVDGRPSLVSLMYATTRHTVMVDGWNMPDSEVLKRTEASARRLQQVSSSAGDPTVISIWCNLGRLVRLAPGTDPEVTIPDAIVSGAVRTAGVNALQIDLSAPLVEAALALGHLPDEGRVTRSKKVE